MTTFRATAAASCLWGAALLSLGCDAKQSNTEIPSSAVKSGEVRDKSTATTGIGPDTATKPDVTGRTNQVVTPQSASPTSVQTLSGEVKK